MTATSCRQESDRVQPSTAPSGAGRLTFRPAERARSTRAGERGLLRLGGRERGSEALVWVPPVEVADGAPLRLVVVLHGAGGNAERALELLRNEAADHRLLLLAPTSAAATWDVITGGYGPDVERIDRLLEMVTAAHPV